MGEPSAVEFDPESPRVREDAPAKAAPRRSQGHGPPAYAALDLGTNNCRLLVARPQGRGFRVVDSFSRIIRFGEGVEETGEISPAAMDRAIACLHVCAGKLRRWRVRRGRYVATEACRKAANGGDFLEWAARETGIRLETIDAGEEAKLAARGCGPLLSARRPYGIVFDIGGGSTEVVWLARRRGQGMRVIDAVSVPMGVVTAADRLNGRDITQALYNELKAEVAEPLKDFDARHHIGGKVGRGLVQMLGASGTVTTVAGIHKGLERYRRDAVDGAMLEFREIDAVARDLFALGPDGRRANPCVGPERADLVLPGCAILDAIRDLWPVGRLRVADRGVREGILLSLMREDARRP